MSHATDGPTHPPDARSPHVSTVVFDLPFDAVWDAVADPMRFPDLYPNWTASVDLAGDGDYAGVGPDGDRFTIVPTLDYAAGVVDFAVVTDDHTEESRSRLFPAGEHACVLVHVAVRPASLDDDAWAAHTRDTDADLERARRLLTEELRQPSD